MWNDAIDWLQSAEGVRVLDSAILPFLAIVLAGVLAALIARSAVRGLMRRAERDAATGVVAATLDAARRVAVWPTLEPSEQRDAERLAGESDLRLRLTALPGAAIAADWAALRTDRLRRIAVHFTRAPEPELQELRDGLIAWLRRPRRAKRLFAKDIAVAREAKPDTAIVDDVTTEPTPQVPARGSAPHDPPRHVSPPIPAVAPAVAAEAPAEPGSPPIAVAAEPLAAPVSPSSPIAPTAPASTSGLDPDGDDIDIDPDDRVPTPPPIPASSVRARTGGDAPLVTEPDRAPAP